MPRLFRYISLQSRMRGEMAPNLSPSFFGRKLFDSKLASRLRQILSTTTTENPILLLLSVCPFDFPCGLSKSAHTSISPPLFNLS